MTVIQTTTGAAIMPAVAPLDGELIMTFNGDKFSRTNLDEMLKNAGVDTVLVAGSSSNVAVMITAYALNTRGYTVGVLEDGLSANTPFHTFYAEYQVLTTGNPDNEPLRKGQSTLTRTDLVTITQPEEMM
jgi:nicotinamidase-related amidase